MIEGIVTVELHAGETVGYVVVKGNGCERVVAPRGRSVSTRLLRRFIRIESGP